MLLQKQFDSVEQMNPLFEQVDGSLLQTGPGGKEWEITMAPLPSGGISHIKCCAPVTGLGATREGSIGEIEGRILQILCETMTGFGSHTQRPPLRCRNRAAVVKRSWDIIRASDDTPVTLEALCQENNVSLRTLEYAFHEIAGMNPNVFLRIHRLHIAQRKMVCGGARFVKEAAYAGGFFHLGRFSADYKMVFGETPLQTLQRIHGRRAGRRVLELA